MNVQVFLQSLVFYSIYLVFLRQSTGYRRSQRRYGWRISGQCNQDSRYIFHIVRQKLTKSGCNQQTEEENETFNEMIAIRILLLVSLVSPAYMFMFSHNFAQTRTRFRTPLSMKLQTGIVGLPNVGKSTLFNALVGSETAQAANFPFCTIGRSIQP